MGERDISTSCLHRLIYARLVRPPPRGVSPSDDKGGERPAVGGSGGEAGSEGERGEWEEWGRVWGEWGSWGECGGSRGEGQEQGRVHTGCVIGSVPHHGRLWDTDRPDETTRERLEERANKILRLRKWGKQGDSSVLRKST